MNFEELKHQIQNPQAGDILTFEFDDALAIDAPIIEVHEDNILVYTDEIGGKLINALEAEYRGRKVKLNKPMRARRRSFRARHNCDNPGPKTKARYWSCRNW